MKANTSEMYTDTHCKKGSFAVIKQSLKIITFTHTDKCKKRTFIHPCILYTLNVFLLQLLSSFSKSLLLLLLPLCVCVPPVRC